jgi:hypothetical protein
METPELGLPRRASLELRAPDELASELERVLGRDNALTVVFVPPELDHAAFATALAARDFGGPVIGCTTAGSIGPSGYGTTLVTAFALPTQHFTCTLEVVSPLVGLDMGRTMSKAREALLRLRDLQRDVSASSAFGFLLVDGLSMREELLASSLKAALGDISLFGGSAADGLTFGRTAVLANGTFASDRAVLALVHTTLPFRVFKTQHFAIDQRRLIVTRADVERRVVREFGGEPAAEAYARAVGVTPQQLGPQVFSQNPVVVRVGGQEYVRSIEKVGDDGSLTFYCAIDEGLVLRIGRGNDLVANLDGLLQRIEGEIGPPQLVIAMDCILRRLELEQIGRLDEAGVLLAKRCAVGFSTYGEQCESMHVNQTLTGVAIGRAAA